jgi:hypothetical protein
MDFKEAVSAEVQRLKDRKVADNSKAAEAGHHNQNETATPAGP